MAAAFRARAKGGPAAGDAGDGAPPSTGSTVIQGLRDTLRGVGLRNTAPRIAVLRELDAAKAPLSHGEIAEKLQDAGFDRATVYRNLIDLTEAGLALRSDHGDHIWRFERKRPEAAGTNHKHPHFVCVECGTVSCLPTASIQVAAVAGTPKSLRSVVDVQVKGHCDTCAD